MARPRNVSVVGWLAGLWDAIWGKTVAFYEGTIGTDIAVSGSAITLVNDTAETIALSINGVTSKVKEGEVLDAGFGEFDSISLDPTTSLGTLQIETATLAAGNVTTAGDMANIITSAELPSSPLTILTPVTLEDITPSLIMAKVRASFAANAEVAAAYVVGGADGAVILTKKGRAKADDATLNVDLGGAGTTAVGITQVAASVDTEAGVAPTAIGYRLWVRG